MRRLFFASGMLASVLVVACTGPNEDYAAPSLTQSSDGNTPNVRDAGVYRDGETRDAERRPVTDAALQDARVPSDAIVIGDPEDVFPPTDTAVADADLPDPDAMVPPPDSAVADADLPDPDAMVPPPDTAVADADLPDPDAMVPPPDSAVADADLPDPDADLDGMIILPIPDAEADTGLDADQPDSAEDAGPDMEVPQDAEVPDAEVVDADLPDPDAGPPPCVDSASITFLFEAQPGDGQYTFRYANDPTPEEGLIPLGDETPFTFTDCQRPVEIWLEDSGGWIFVIGNDVDILMVNGVDILSVPLDEELVSYEPTEGVAQSFLQQGNVYIRIE